MARDEWPCGRAAVQGLEDRGLDLEEVPGVQDSSRRRDDARSGAEHLTDVRIHGEVRVSLAVAGLGVGKAAVGGSLARVGVHLSLPQRERAQRLGEQEPVVDLNCDLAHARTEHGTGDSDPVTEVEKPQIFEGCVPDDVLAKVHLDAAGPVLEVGERALPHVPVADQPPPQTHRPGFAVFVQIAQLLAGLEAIRGVAGPVGPLVAVGEGLDPALAQLFQLFAARAQHFAQIWPVARI